MLLVRIEPIENTPFPLTADKKKELFFSSISERTKARMLPRYESEDWGNIIGCWFMPAYAKTGDELDAITYANTIIGPDHPESDLRIIAIEIDDVETDAMRACNKMDNSFVQQRCKNPDAEYIVPTDMIVEKAEVIATIPKGKQLSEASYRGILTEHEKLNNRQTVISTNHTHTPKPPVVLTSPP